MQIYLVGGAVRDKILGFPPKEHDWVVVGATPEKMLSMGYIQVGKDFPVFLHPKTKEEYALARKERKTSRGYYGFECDFDPHVTLEEDLLRRDLTINAIAMSEQGVIIDPYGGQKDIQQKILRHVSHAFIEDPVRVLRVARFATRFQHLGFSIAPETRQLMYKMVSLGELSHLIPERVWQEWERSLHETSPEAFITTLRACGALKVLLPELDALFGVPASLPYHPEIDSGIHTLEVLEHAKRIDPDPVLLFTAVLHDLGKGRTPKEKWPSHKDHDEGGLPIIVEVCNRYKVPRVYKEAAIRACQYHLNIYESEKLDAEEIVDILMNAGAYRHSKDWYRLIKLCEADANTPITGAPTSFKQFWDACLQATLTIQAQPFIEQGFKGKEIQLAIKNARIELVNQVKRGECGQT